MNRISRDASADTIQNRANRWSGFLVALGMGALLLVSDPLLLFTGPGKAEAGWGYVDATNVAFTSALAAVSLLAWAVFWHSRVVVGPKVLVIYNPLHVYTVPLDRIIELDTAFRRVPLLVLADKKLRVFGAEQSLRMQVSSRSHRITRLLHQAIDAERPEGSPGDAVQVRWQRPDWLGAVLILFWAAAVSIVTVKWMAGIS